MKNSHSRPDPDALLAELGAKAASNKRGRLKVYLGMAAGSGKTYAMLSDALVEKKRGTDVVSGYIEAHGRTETDALANEFESIPVRSIEHRGIKIHEFDIDSALKRKPTILLVDELAHSNAPGLRHSKRWQDIEELLRAGISVSTTVNIQHLESLCDIVTQITGAPVQETVPDSVVMQADEIEVVDVTPEELIQRLKDGKIYSPDKVPQALSNFFRAGNLIALRELVLRHSANRVDAELQSFRKEHKIYTTWPATPRVLVCVAPNALADRAVRAARRLASSMHAELIALSVEAPRYSFLTARQRTMGERALLLAEKMGAEVVSRTAQDIVGEIVSVARARNVSMIVVGKPLRSRLRELIQGSVVDDLIRRSEEIDVYVISGQGQTGTQMPVIERSTGQKWEGITRAFIGTAAATALGSLMFQFFDQSNIVMLYLLSTVWVAYQGTRTAAVVASITSVLAFDFFFVPPFWTFSVSDVQYLVTFGTMLVIGLIITQLTLRLRRQVEISSEREQRTANLYEFSKLISVARTTNELKIIVQKRISELLSHQAFLMIPKQGEGLDDDEEFNQLVPSPTSEIAVARWSLDHVTPAGAGTDTLSGSKGMYLPIEGSEEPLGVLAILAAGETLPPSKRQMLEVLVYQLKLAMERITLEDTSKLSAIEMERERLRTTLLSSVSHDFRTPLAAIAGAASTLMERSDSLTSESIELVTTISQESDRLDRMVRNILDLTRLEKNTLQLKSSWESLDELIASALRRTSLLLEPRKVSINLPYHLPLVKVDPILIEQVFVNLFENIAKHTAPTVNVQVIGEVFENKVNISISDNGTGFAVGDEEKAFQRMYRGGRDGSQGFGLGLTVCRAIMEAHSGEIRTSKSDKTGATILVSIPRSMNEPEVQDE